MKNILFTIVALILILNVHAQAPVAKFSAQVDSTCGPTLTNNFTDLSSNAPTSWKWYFPGATPDTSTLRNPTNIQYNGYGCYTVKLVVKNNNGSDSLTDSNFICLDQMPKITISGNPEICQGQHDTLSLTASRGRYYRWSTGATTSSISFPVYGIISKTYIIGLQSGACYKDTSVTISVDTPPQTYFKGDTLICVGDSTIIYALPFPGHSNYGYTYLWNTGSTTDSIIVRGDSASLYTYYVSISKGACSRDSEQISVRVNICTGVENYNNFSGISIFPNPATHQLSVLSDGIIEKNVLLSISDITERTLVSEKINLSPSQLNIDVSSLSPGIYFLKLQTDKGMVVKKFVKD